MVHSARALRERRRPFDSDKCGHSDEHFHFALAVDSYRARFCFTVSRPSRISRGNPPLPPSFAGPDFIPALKSRARGEAEKFGVARASTRATTNVKSGFISATPDGRSCKRSCVRRGSLSRLKRACFHSTAKNTSGGSTRSSMKF